MRCVETLNPKSTLPAFALENTNGAYPFFVLKGSREGVRDGAPSAASFAA